MPPIATPAAFAVLLMTGIRMTSSAAGSDTDHGLYVKGGGDVSNLASGSQVLCPSYCDSDGRKHDRQICVSLPFCCLGPGLLDCCDDSSLQIGSDVDDNYNCSSSEWKTVLGVCVPLGSLCFIGIIVLLVYRYRFSLRDFLFPRGPDRRHSDCSTVSSATTRDATPRHSQRHHVDVTYLQELTVVSASPQHVDIFSVQEPPPYAVQPPQYSDIFPS